MNKKLFKNHGKKIAAIEDNGQKITYDKLFSSGDELLKIINKRCLVFSFCKNTIGSLIGYTAFQCSDIVPLLLDAKLDMELCQNLIEAYHPEFIWAPSSQKFEVITLKRVYEKYGYVLYKTIYEGYALNEELFLLLTTSGSTGSPKLVRQSYKNILSNTKSIIKYLEIDEHERPITTLPMNYTYGLSIINTHLYVGATLLLTDRTLLDKNFWEFFKSEKATSFGGVPYTYEMLNRLHFFDLDLPHLTTMTQAGGKLLPELHKKFAEHAEKTNKKFVVMYGQTEATARMAYLPAEYSLNKYGSMGIAIPGGRFELIDTDNQIINQPDIVGELVYYGENVTLGYAESGPDLLRGDERSGILYTGDMAKRDADGFYYIVGRKKRFLKMFGNRVNLDEIERLIKSNFDIPECACTGQDDKMKIFVTKANNKTMINIKRFISAKTGLNNNAFLVKTISEIPKNDSGKILYNQLGQ